MKQLFVLCALVAGCACRSVQESNELIDGILSDAAINMENVVDLPNLDVSQSYQLIGLKASVKVNGAVTWRQEPYVVRKGDSASSGFSDAEVVEARISSGLMTVRLDDVVVSLGFMNLQSSAILKYQGEYHLEITISKTDNGKTCTSKVVFFDLAKPELDTFQSEGVTGTLLELIVYFLKSTAILRNSLYKFFGPVFSATTGNEIDRAVSNAVCKSS